MIFIIIIIINRACRCLIIFFRHVLPAKASGIQYARIIISSHYGNLKTQLISKILHRSFFPYLETLDFENALTTCKLESLEC